MRHPYRFSARDHACYIHAIAADIEEGSASHFGAPAYVVAGLKKKAKRGPYHFDVAHRACVRELPDALGLWVEAVHEGLHQSDAVRLSGINHFLGFRGVQGQGLFAEHVLAVLSGLYTPLFVEGIRGVNYATSIKSEASISS